LRALYAFAALLNTQILQLVSNGFSYQRWHDDELQFPDT